MRVVIAARLSKLTNGQTGLDTQDIHSREWAEQNGHTVVAVVMDRKSGTSHPWERKNLKPWMTKPEMLAQYDAILGFKIDRLSRGDDESTSMIEQWARDHGKILLTADGLYYPCEGADGTRWDVMKRLAHQEWLSISERYRRMHSYLRDNGFRAYGYNPYGFVMATVEGSEHKTLAPDPVEAPFIREAVTRYLDGMPLLAVCKWLDNEGCKPRRAQKWSPSTLQKILRNPALHGRSVDADGKTIHRHEGIIGRTTWDRLQDALSRKAYRKGIANGDAALLLGIAFCSKCDGPMYRHSCGNKRKDGTKSTFLYYRCHGDEINPSKCRNMIPLEELEGHVDEHMRNTSPGAHGARPVMQVVTIPGHGYAQEIADVDQEIRDLDLDDPKYLDKWAMLRAKRAELKALPATPDRTEKRETGLTVAEHWATLDTAGRRAFLLASKARVIAERDFALVRTHDEWALA